MYEKTEIAGCFTFKQAPIFDNRGYFLKTYTEPEDSHSREPWLVRETVKEIFWSKSFNSVARGMHLQLPPCAMSKFVSCVDGWITDYILDLRIDQPSYGKCLKINLGVHDDGRSGVTVPPGCAHGFVTNSASALVLYLQSGPYCAEHDGGVNMAQFLLPEHTDVIFSDRDKSLPLIDDFSGISTAKWMRT